MMKIEILGTGCMKCEKLYENAKRAVGEMGIDADIEKIGDIDKIIASGVMLTPAIAIDGEIKASGRIPCKEEIKQWIK